MRRIGPKMVSQRGWRHQAGASASRVRCMQCRGEQDGSGVGAFPFDNIHPAATALPWSFLASMSSLPHRKETFVQRNLSTVSNFSLTTA